MSVREDPANPSMHPRDGQLARNGATGTVMAVERRRPRRYPVGRFSGWKLDLLIRDFARFIRSEVALLALAAGIVRASLRSFDTVGRNAGDGHIAILPQTNRDEARRIAARLRSQLVNSPTPSFERALTPSLGVGQWTPGTPTEELLAAADRALLAAKRSAPSSARADRA